MEKWTPEQLCAREEKLRADRSNWEQHWQELVDYGMPNVQDVITKRTPGDKKGAELFDNTATVACEMLASALHGMLTNPNVLWFELQPKTLELLKKDNVREYLQEVVENLHRIINNTNFQTEIHQFDIDLCLIGTAAMAMSPDMNKVAHYSTKHISEYVISENNLGMVDELHRTFKWNAQQIIQEFTPALFGKGIDIHEIIKNRRAEAEDKLTREVIDAFVNGRPEKFELIHGVYKSSYLENIQKPFTSQYVLKAKKEKKELRTRGFRRFPYLVARWVKRSGEIYGRSPMMTALPEAKSVNQMVKAVIKAAQKVVDPPTQGPDDGFLRPLRTHPGSHHYYRAGTQDRIEAIFKDINPRIGFELIRDRQVQIREAFFVDKLNLLQGDRMTTVEVNQRIEEQLRFLSPMLGRQRYEVLIPFIDTLIDFAVDADGGSGEILGETPAELQDEPLFAQYTSPIARAQLVTQGQSMFRALEASAPFIELDPNARDVIDSEQAIRENWRSYGAPQKALRSNKELEEIRQARQKAQEQAIQRQTELEDAEKLNKVAPALKQ